MINKKYYKKLGGFSYLLGEVSKKLGKEQTDALVNDAVTLCNEFCDKYKELPKKEKLHTEQMIFPRGDLFADDKIYPARGSYCFDRRRRKNRRRTRQKAFACRDKDTFYSPAVFQDFPQDDRLNV